MIAPHNPSLDFLRTTHMFREVTLRADMPKEVFPVGRTVSPLFDTSQVVLPGAASTPPDRPEEARAWSAATAAVQGRLFNRAVSEASSSRWARSQRSQRRLALPCPSSLQPIHGKKVGVRCLEFKM